MPASTNRWRANMLYVIVTRHNGKILTAEVTDYEGTKGRQAFAENRNNWRTYEAAKEIAAALGDGYIATDAGPNVSPRYDVIALPKVGDKVSYAFNGDSYPCGKIVSISKSLRVITTQDGNSIDKFYRVRETGTWLKNRTWSLVSGHVYEQNPSF